MKTVKRYVVARATRHFENGEDAFDYPSLVAELGGYCDLIDSWVQAKLWAGIASKLLRASALLEGRIAEVLAAREGLGVRFDEALALAMHGGTIELDDPPEGPSEFKLLCLVCNGAGARVRFQAHPQYCLTPASLMRRWPLLEALTVDGGEPQDAPPLAGWLIVE